MLRLSYTLRDTVYNLAFGGKYNLIAGDSGTGKTQLARFAYRLQARGTAGKLPIYGDQVYIAGMLQHIHNSVVVIDEEFSPSVLHALGNTIKSSDNLYIFCFRNDLGDLPFGIDSIFQLVGNTRHRSMIPYFSGKEFTRNITDYSCIITEDSKSSYLALLAKYPNTKIVSSEGNSNLKDVIMSCEDDSVIICDLCGIGCHIFDILNAAYTKHATVFDTESFEHEIIRKVFQKGKIAFPYKVWMQEESPEAYYERILNHLLRQKTGLAYNKSASYLMKLFGSGHSGFQGKHLSLSEFGLSNTLYDELQPLQLDNPKGLKHLIL